MATFDFAELFEVGDYLHFYEDTLRDEDTPAQVTAIEQRVGMRAGDRVLDAGCGHGRHALEFARRGYTVVGVDLVAGFIEHAAAQAAAEGLALELRHGDVRALGESAAFDHVVCLFDAFGFLDDAGNTDMLRAMARSLRPGGSLCLDVRNRDWMTRSLLPTTVLEKGDDLMIDRHALDSDTGRLVDRRIVVRDGKVKHRPFSIRVYNLGELRLLCAEVGLDVEAALGGFDGGPVSLARNRIVLFARRSRAATDAAADGRAY